MSDEQNEGQSIETAGQYTAEMLAQAAKRLKAITPEGLLDIERYLNEMEQMVAQQFPEAGSVLWCVLRSSRSGATYNLTIRAVDGVTAIKRMSDALRYAEEIGLVPIDPNARWNTPVVPAPPKTSAVSASGDTEPAFTTQVTTVHSQSSPQPSQAQTPPAMVGANPSGVAQILRMVITSNRIEYELDGLKYPLKDARGPRAWAQYFDSDTGFDESVLAKAGVYESPGLYAYWEKVGKYYNVTRVCTSP